MATNDVVVLLPGIMGSALGRARDGRPAREDPVWDLSPRAARGAVLSFGRSLRALALPPGIGDEHPRDGIEPIGLIQRVQAIPGLWTPVQGYTALVARLRNSGFRAASAGAPGNLVEFPYDWRLSSRFNGRRLKRVVEDALGAWRAQGGPYAEARVIFVAHSMGGLVARWYIEQEGGAEITRTLITLGTPWRGSVNAVKNLIEGPMRLPILGSFLLPLAASLPSLHQLLPVYACVERGRDLLTLTEAGAPGLGAEMTADAALFHRSLADAEAARPGAVGSTHLVVGSKQGTLTSVREDGRALRFERTLQGQDHFGDGTVPLPGALGLGLAPTAPSVHYIADLHSSLPANGAVLDHVEAVATARDVVFRGEAEVELRLDAPDVVAEGEEIEVSVEIASGEQVGLVVAAYVDGVEVDRYQPAVRGGRASAAFGPFEAGVVSIQARGVAQGTVAPVTADVIVWDQRE